MNPTQYYEYTPNSVDFSGYERGESNKIPYGYLGLYLVLSIVICYLYHKKIVAAADWYAPNSLNAVASFNTAKPYQFRLLMPVIFDFFRPLHAVYGKYLYGAWNVAALLLLQVVFYKLLCGYFKNKKYLLWVAPVILYPVLFNYILLNQSFQYYDFTAILLFTVGLYYIMTRNTTAFFIFFVIAIINKETAGYLIFAYMLFNYKELFTREIIRNTAILGAIFIGYKLLLGYIFRANPGDSFEIGYYENIRIVNELLSNRTLLKNLALNFGGLYLFVILLFITGLWKKYPDRRKVFMNLAIVPYYIFGIYITYITEVRVYTELIPMITVLFLIFLSSFKFSGLVPREFVIKK
ncbi:MAG TPA: hypothetical protein PK605_05415 [Ignavibacteria bacterium]|nr:hypothetical protein [Bacteroidota bacterium]HRE09270.1 hypothetical protein [Ignavibacteria bacterium]HRF66231.1 hypothetical protein [Ignavibacteria bacterium]HRJ03823.1 hypothetical protein [Ignavibacteria bacterium]HRJ85108.1 hypothetical protein [Ignavibacteria bacterium]